MKYIILVGDGMGDLPLSDLKDRTPLEAANTPAMDHLCQHGELFRLQTIPTGMHPGSDIANLSLLGYEPQHFYTGRAPLEAASMGIDLGDDETVYRCNLVTLEKNAEGSLVMVDFSAGNIPTVESNILIKGLQDELGSDWIHFYPGISYRHLMTNKKNLPDLETVPPHDYIGQNVSEFWERYMQHPELQLLLQSACKLLENHPVNIQRAERGLLSANAIWLWGEGKAPTIPTIEKQFGVKGSLISAVDLLKGIGYYGGLDIINVEGATGDLNTNYGGKAAAALKTLSEQDFVFVHVEAPDEAGHQGIVGDKVRAIENFDSKIIKPIFEGMQSMEGSPDFRLVVCMDHFTPISTRTHSDEPVPVLLYDSRQQGPESGLSYSEANGKKSNTLLSSGREFFNKLLEK